jgi:hypothetical protein
MRKFYSGNALAGTLLTRLGLPKDLASRTLGTVWLAEGGALLGHCIAARSLPPNLQAWIVPSTRISFKILIWEDECNGDVTTTMIGYHCHCHVEQIVSRNGHPAGLRLHAIIVQSGRTCHSCANTVGGKELASRAPIFSQDRVG